MKIVIALIVFAAACLVESSFQTIPKKFGGFQSVPHIVGGDVAEPQSYPYAVFLEINWFTDQKSRCAGALISAEWILTAAHCVKAEGMWIMATIGTSNVDEYPSTKQKVHVKEYITHPEWDTARSIDNDIALLRLGQPVNLNENVTTIRLPSLSHANKSFWQNTATIIGWGKTADDSDMSPVLMSVDTKIITNFYCNYQYGMIKDFHVCSDGSDRKGVCNGDGGNPLVVKDQDGQPMLLGVTSFGSFKGCEESYPTVFTRITNYLQWISDTTSIPLRK